MEEGSVFRAVVDKFSGLGFDWALVIERAMVSAAVGTFDRYVWARAVVGTCRLVGAFAVGRAVVVCASRALEGGRVGGLGTRGGYVAEGLTSVALQGWGNEGVYVAQGPVDTEATVEEFGHDFAVVDCYDQRPVLFPVRSLLCIVQPSHVYDVGRCRENSAVCAVDDLAGDRAFRVKSSRDIVGNDMVCAGVGCGCDVE